MTTYSEAVEQTIIAGEQIHQIVNGTATTEVTVEDGSKIPSVRKALIDNFYFKDPIAWQVGQTENVFNQLRQFTDGSWWYAPSATASNLVSMGSTPIGDSLWKLYPLDPYLREDLSLPSGAGLVGGLPIFVTAEKYAGGATTTSTNNDVAIIAAINDAMASGSYVYWPDVYEVQGNILNFHSVRHDGPGGIKRGSDTFRVHPLESNTNTLYSAPLSSAGNDGLTADLPFSGVQVAFDAIQNNWSEQFCSAKWVLKLAAGTYNAASTFSKPLSNTNRFEVQGPPAAFGVPTAIVDGSSLPSNSIGMYFQGLRRIKLQDIWFRKFPGTNGQGVTADGRVDFYAVNVHATECGWCGLNQTVQGQLRVEGGRFALNRTGIRCYSGVTYTIGYNGSVNRTVLEGNTASGFLAQNNSAGHVDDVDVLNNAAGIYLVNQSRAHLLRTNLSNNNSAVIAESSSTYIKNDVVFSGNIRDELTKAFSIPEAFVDEFTFNPVTNAMAFGLGRAGVNPSTGYEYSFGLSGSGSGIQLLAPDNKIISFTFGSPSNATAGRLSYDLSSDTMRFITSGSNRLFLSATGLLPLPDNTIRLGSPGNNRFTEVCAVNGTINTSDGREKTNPQWITDAMLDAADDISINVWRWLDAIRLKGSEAARWHFGPIAQQVRDAFAKHGLDGCDYGLLCYDKWDDEFEEGIGKDGKPTGNRKLVNKAGDRWGIRPDQCLWLLAAAARRRAERAEKRLTSLEERLTKAGL